MIYRKSLKYQVFCGIIILSLVSSSNCRSTARIVKTDDTILTGTITPSDKENVYLEYYGRRTIVPRSEIKEVVYPGIGLMRAGGYTLGGGLAFGVFGLLLYTSDTRKSPNYGDRLFAELFGGMGMIIGAVGAGVGLILLLSGYSSYRTSKSNFEPDGLAFWSPAPGVYLGYQSVIQRPLIPYTGYETIHEGRINLRF